MNYFRRLLFLMCFPGFSFAQSTQIDLALTIENAPLSPWVLGQAGVIRFRVTNLSTTQGATSRIFLLDPIPELPGIPDGFEGSGALPSCPQGFGCSSFGQTCFDPPGIPPNSSVTCEFYLRAAYPGVRPARSRGNVVVFNAIDPNLANNVAQEDLGILDELNAVPLSPLTMLGLIALIGGLGIGRVRA